MALRLLEPGRSDLEMARLLVEEHELRMQVQRLRLGLQDSWYLAYLMVDAIQDAAPPARLRHYSPRVMNIVDTARRVLTRNPLKYHVVGRHFRSDSRQEREPLRTFENVLHGVQYDIDRQLRNRGEQRGRHQAAFHGLVRGQWAFKLHLTSEAKTSTGSPIFYEQYDPRLCLPTFDYLGQADVIAWNVVTLNQMLAQYPEILNPLVRRILDRHRFVGGSRPPDMNFMHSPLILREWSSREEHGLLLDLQHLPDDASQAIGLRDKDRHTAERYVWLETPREMGLDWSLIQTGNVNGIPTGLVEKERQQSFSSSPLMKTPIHRGGDETVGYVPNATTVLPQGMMPGFGMHASLIDPGAALAGRSIFAGISHLIPEFNLMLSLLKDGVKQNVLGTWVYKSTDGSLAELALGTGSVNPMQLRNNLERVVSDIKAPDALSVLQVLNQEIADGSLDLRFILASESEGSGFLRARLEQAALIALDPYKEGVQDYGDRAAEAFIRQYRKSPQAFGKFTLTGRVPGASTSFFVVDIDDDVKKLLTEGKEPPVIESVVKASMPVDMMARINMAKSAIDPSNPIMSLSMALDMILELDDAEAAYDMIMEDIGNRNPTIQLLNIAQAFKDNGAPEVATMILNDQFRQAFSNATQQGRTNTPSGAAAGTLPGTTPPEVTSGGGTEPTNQGRLGI